ncbi:MAG TPA: hypothetical protein VGJ15_02480 [Pirellulales bacterium]|jgi:hypothetical protein
MLPTKSTQAAMHTRELIDLAAFAASQGQVLLEGLREVPPSPLARYWTASKCRLERWKVRLRELGDQLRAARGDNDYTWRHLRSLGEEVLVSEMLTRIWSSILTTLDVAFESDEAQPLAASVLAGHLEASNSVLLMIANDRSSASAGAELNRLRRLTERWTDLLLAGLGSQFETGSFAHDANRVVEFSRDFVQSNQRILRLQAWALLTASLHATFDMQLQAVTPNADLNQNIAGAILGCFPSEAFDSTGTYHSLWMLRLASSANDTQLLVDQLLDCDSRSHLSAPFVSRN